ncbi:hypothetical protein J3R30DRAFT_3428684 [Lentinula aciculospora]|uniref:Uncharacterized protein n=1 Tax=Lentinula aciculospora TaxID=153920 RepID=A0A9W9DVU6_9AGAR|nr:hypothetical protein J3R30DRAFT_3428684 [Lentinula aciculospora]
MRFDVVYFVLGLICIAFALPSTNSEISTSAPDHCDRAVISRSILPNCLRTKSTPKSPPVLLPWKFDANGRTGTVSYSNTAVAETQVNTILSKYGSPIRQKNTGGFIGDRNKIFFSISANVKIGKITCPCNGWIDVVEGNLNANIYGSVL